MSKRSPRRPPPAPEAPKPSPWQQGREWLHHPRARWALPTLIGLTALLISAWTFDDKLSLSGDNTEFVTLARSLAAGEGLTYTHLPQPRPATKYPFGFPLLLAPVAAVFGGWEGPGSGTPDWVAMKWLVTLTFAGSAALLFVLVHHVAGRGPAAATTLLVVTNPFLVSYGHQVMSEVPYLMLSLLALWLLDRGLQSEGWRENHWLWAGIAVSLAAYYTRSVGIVLMGAAGVHLLLQRDWRRALFLGGTCFVGMLPWMFRNRAVGGGAVYLKQLVLVNPYFPERGYLDATGLWQRVAHHWEYYLRGELPHALWSWLPVGADSLVNLGSLLLLVFVLATVFSYVRRRQQELLFLYAALFTVTVMLWPWPGDRFFLPAIPVFLFLAVQAGGDALRWLRDRVDFPRAAAGAILVGLVALANLPGLSQLEQISRRDYPASWRNYYDAGLWLRGNVEVDAVVACRKPFWLHVVSGRRTAPYIFKKPAELLADLESKGVDHVVVEQLGFRSTALFLLPAIDAHQERFEGLWIRRRPDTAVFRLAGAGG